VAGAIVDGEVGMCEDAAAGDEGGMPMMGACGGATCCRMARQGTSRHGSRKGRSSLDGGGEGVGVAGALERKGNTSSSK
jgi:hypothetical protein